MLQVESGQGEAVVRGGDADQPLLDRFGLGLGHQQAQPGRCATADPTPELVQL
jgi:hypothetical protein